MVKGFPLLKGLYFSHKGESPELFFSLGVGNMEVLLQNTSKKKVYKFSSPPTAWTYLCSSPIQFPPATVGNEVGDLAAKLDSSDVATWSVNEIYSSPQ